VKIRSKENPVLGLRWQRAIPRLNRKQNDWYRRKPWSRAA